MHTVKNEESWVQGLRGECKICSLRHTEGITVSSVQGISVRRLHWTVFSVALALPYSLSWHTHMYAEVYPSHMLDKTRALEEDKVMQLDTNPKAVITMNCLRLGLEPTPL
jgi:hypothetical protein